MTQATTIQDRVYGGINFEEPVFQALIECPSMVRLKGVDMGGYFEVHVPGSSHSRFEHSVGVAWLLKKFGASLEEQVAGLLHDVSHSAFSHAIDYAVSTGTEASQSYQDDVHADFLQRTEIPGILEQHGFRVEDILDDSRHPLKERDLPDLCADRIDYSLRGAMAYHRLKREDIQKYLDDLKIINQQWVFKNYDTAISFAELFRLMNHTYYSGKESAHMFRTTGDWLAHALKKGYITLSELYDTDQSVIEKVNRHLGEDKELEKYWRRMNLGTKYVLVENGKERTITCKSRMVDPLFLEGEKIFRVSERDPKWGNIVKEESKPKEYTFAFED